MNRCYAVILFAGTALPAATQDIYFPPVVGSAWETVDPAALGWCTEEIPALLDFLGENNTKAFIVLKDGRIAIEQYYGTFTQDSSWYWASAGKSLTAFMVGKAQEQGFLDIDEPSNTFLGTGWTSCTPAQEDAITIKHQLTMTTGLDDGVPDLDCTDPACLQYLADPGTRWSYHNAPYTMLDGVIAEATGQTLNGYVYSTLGQTTGMLGLYLPVGSNNVFFSTARSMARFGLIALNQGNWNGTQILNTTYFNEMVSPSQALNDSYGYLWWLNGQSSFMAPGSQIVFPGELMPNEPDDAYNALGKNGQFINVVPSEGIVLIRMGNIPDDDFPVPVLFNNDIWAYMSEILCTPTSARDVEDDGISVFPTITSDRLQVRTNGQPVGGIEIISCDGSKFAATLQDAGIDVSRLAEGAYTLRLLLTNGTVAAERFQVIR